MRVKILLTVLLGALLCGCNSKDTVDTVRNSDSVEEQTENVQETDENSVEVDLDALFASSKPVDDTASQTFQKETVEWQYLSPNVIDDKYRNYYEIFVYSFCDSDGDGIGDLQGVISKLDYLNDGDPATDNDLGITGIWLMPVMPSTTYHKYDVTDYMDIDPAYGNLKDFEKLIEECHNRGIEVIIDFVMNHSSSKHMWFETACEYLKTLSDAEEPDKEACPYIDYYHFTKEPQGGYSKVDGTDWYYEAQFWSEMPDLNLQSEAVRKEFESITDFWIEMGVDGFRLDAVKEFESGNTEVNIEILSWFNDYTESVKQDFYLVCECWTDATTYSQYYDSGVDSMFDFQFADKDGLIAKAVNGKVKASSLGQRLEEEDSLFASHNADYINAPFYANHDMGRSAGYYKGNGDLCQTKLGHGINLLMTGNAFLYYGEELGMKGSGKDENKRAPMYWSKDSASEGMCEGPKDMDSFSMKFDSLEEQCNDTNSIYWYVKRVLQARNHFPAIARGKTLHLSDLSTDQVCVLRKTYEQEEVILVYNCGATLQEIDLSSASLLGESLQAKDMVILADLSTNEHATYENGVASLPGYSIIVLGNE